ncbi:hypothetical protein ACWEDZ_02855 [Streptomyces sp. NPDC005047]
MQNHVKTPGGLRTGSGPTYVGSGAKVTCYRALCDNEPTHVMTHTTHEGKTLDLAAHCLPCLEKEIRPAAEVEAANNRDIQLGRTGGLNGLPDDRWGKREFTEQEAAEIGRIKAGELVETYISPGVFEWQPPVVGFVARELEKIDDQISGGALEEDHIRVRFSLGEGVTKHLRLTPELFKRIKNVMIEYKENDA